MKNYILTAATADGAQGLIDLLCKNSDNKVVLISRSKSEKLETLAQNKNILYFSGIDCREFDNKQGL